MQGREVNSVEPDGGLATGTSRWQMVVGIIGLLVILWVGNSMLNTFSGAGPDPAAWTTNPGKAHNPLRSRSKSPRARTGPATDRPREAVTTDVHATCFRKLRAQAIRTS